MKILVFVKQVPDTDDVKLDPKTGNLKREGVASMLNPLDANAVEAAVQLKEKYGATVVAISMAQYMCGVYTTYTMTGKVSGRTGNASPAFQPYNLFKSKDGFDVALGAFGPGVYKRCLQGLGFDLNYFTYQDCSSNAEAVASPKGRELNDKVVAWCASHTAAEIEEAMRSWGLQQ